MTSNPSETAALVRAYLQSQGLTQRDFARRVDVSEASLSRLLAGRPPHPDTVGRIHGALLDALREERRAETAGAPGSGRVVRVFLSSTFLDLEDRRSLIIRAVESFGDLKCVAMERFTASLEPALDTSLRELRRCDLFISILAYRYGWIPDGHDRSIVELEHDTAQQLGIPRLAFEVDPAQRPPNEAVDMDEGPDRWKLRGRLEEFKARLRGTGVTPRPFGDDADLVHFVHQAVREWLERTGRSTPATAMIAAPELNPWQVELGPYQDALLAANRDLPMVGMASSFRMPMRIEDLYVPLRAGRRPLMQHEDERDPDARTFAEEDESLAFVLPAERDDAGVTVFSRALSESRRIISVLGEAGSGKTSLLRRLAYHVLTARDAEEHLGLEVVDERPEAPGLLPVLIPLAGKTAADFQQGLPEFIEATQPQHAGMTPDLCRRLVEEHGRLLVLLDGLDEVAQEDRDEAARWVVRQARACPEALFVLTSRPAGYPLAKTGGEEGERGEEPREGAAKSEPTPLQDAHVVEIKHLTDDQIEVFVERWYATVERGMNPVGWEQRAEEGGKHLLTRLASRELRASRVREMTANPMLLTVICLVHLDGGKSLPEHHAVLYQRVIEVLVERWRRRGSLGKDLPDDVAGKLLEPIAAYLHAEEGRKSATAEELAGPECELDDDVRSGIRRLLQRIRDESGVLCGESGSRYRFLHLGLQEYLVARRRRNRFARYAFSKRSEAEAILDLLVENFGRSWWREVLVLLFALPGEPNLFEPFVRHLLARRPWAVEDHEALFVECERDALEVSTDPYVEFLGEALGNPELEGATRVIGRRLLASGDGALDRFLDKEHALVEKLLEQGPAETALKLIERARARGSVRLGQFDHAYRRRACSSDSVHGSTAGRGVARATRLVGGIRLVRVEAGRFWMGSQEEESGRASWEGPVREVDVGPFWLAATPVTNAQYRRFVAETDYRVPDSWKERRLSADEQPVVTVSWEDAWAFCRWAGLRLPSEAEWEFACRAGMNTRFWFGDDVGELSKHAWYGGQGGAPHAVDQKPANPWGLSDMHGNVREWCEDDWHTSYERAPIDGAPWNRTPRIKLRVLRGGSWKSHPRRCRSAYRFWRDSGERLSVVGFRPAATD